MTTPLSFWQELLLLFLAALSLVYVLYFRIWLALAIGSDVLFALALGMAVASIATPGLFRHAAGALVDHSPLPSALQAADSKVAVIEALPQTLIDQALAKIGFGPEDEQLRSDSFPGRVESEHNPETVHLSPRLVAGPFVSTIRPSVEALVSTVLRFASFVCGSFMMLTSLAMRSSTTTARRLQKIAQRLDALESSRATAEPPPS